MTIIPRNGIPGKVCPVCKQWRELQHFKGNGKSSDGHDHKCRDCRGYRLVQHEWRNGVKGKHCTICGKWAALEGFPVNRRRSDGRDSLCLGCSREKSRRYWEADPQTWRARQRRSYSRHRETRRQRNKRSREANLEAVRAYDRARGRERYRRNPAIRNVYTHRRRARLQNAAGEFTASEWRQLKVQYNNTCLCCGAREPEVKLTIDHVIPLARGGRNDIGNIQPLCLTCNLRKATKTTDYRRLR